MIFIKQAMGANVHLRFFCCVALILCVSGCGITQGLTHSESLANFHPLFLTAKKSKGEILVTEGLGHLREGSFEQFLASMTLALTYYEDDNEKSADIRRYLGKAYLDRNEYDKALSSFESSLVLAKKSNYLNGSVLAKIGLADCYMKIGDADKAMETISGSQDTPHSANGQDPLISLSRGQILAKQGKLVDALDVLRKTWTNLEKSTDNKLKLSVSTALGTTLSGLGRNGEAIVEFRHALELARKSYSTADIVDILNNLGFCQIALGKYDDAARSFQEGAGILSVMHLNYPEKQLYINLGLGMVYEAQWKNAQAFSHYTQAISSIEELRGSLSSTDFRSLFLANKVAAYEHAIDILIATAEMGGANVSLPRSFLEKGLSPAEVAFYYAESTKARSFLDLLTKGRALANTPRLPRDLADRERRLLSTIDSIQSAGGEQTDGQRNLLKKSRQELDQLISLLRREYPDYASIRYPEPVMAASVPLRDNEVLLTYKVNPGKTYVWILEKGKPARTLGIAVSQEDLVTKVKEFRNELDNPFSAQNQVAAKSQALGRLLLRGALAKIAPDKNIIIVPDNILNMLPFEALMLDDGTNSRHYAGDRYRISYYPSASVMASMRRLNSKPRLPNTFFGLGDPIYDLADSRLKNKGKRAEIATAGNDKTNISMRNAIIRSGFTLNRLPETRDEVLSIGALFGYKQDNKNIKLDMNASKKELLNVPLGSYQYIHFATHGLLGGDIPYILEPALVLTLPGNDRQEDGFLTMSEVLGLRLNADAVVLSACKTALGKEIAGEGVIGLSRAFMLAGAKSVIVSLWSVESSSTAELMKSFYTHLKSGKTKEAALRLAKADLKNNGGTNIDQSRRGLSVVGRSQHDQADKSRPFFWAPFILIGEWE